MVSDVNIGIAFIAGLVSFLSPCVLPLVPAYVGYMGGRATNEAGKQNRQKFSTFIHGIFFVLGFTLFFVGFGLLTAAASSFLQSIGINIPTLITRLGGVAVLLFGLYVMKLLDPVFRWLLKLTKEWKDEEEGTAPLVFTVLVITLTYVYFVWAFGAEIPFSLVWAAVLLLGFAMLFRKPMNTATSLADFWHKSIYSLQVALASDTRNLNIQPNAKKGYWGSLGMGVVFSAGWTPCIGPVYAAVIALANDAVANGESLLSPALMFTSYSLGLGIPFLMTALAFNQSVTLMNQIKRHMATVERVSGVFLIFIGVLILTGSLNQLTNRFGSGEFAELSFRLEGCTAAAAQGHIPTSDYPGCVSDGIDKLEDRFISAVNKYEDESGIPQFTFDEPANLDEIPTGIKVGERAPNFTLQNLDGDEVSLDDFRGQPVLINFWYTACGPCRQEMPEFEQVYQLEKDAGFVILAVNAGTFEPSVDDIGPFMEQYDLTFPVVLDKDGNTLKEYGILGYPTSYLIDGNGVIVAKQTGPWSGQDLAEELNKFERTLPVDSPSSTAFVTE